jgi:hypothetical protein
VLAGEAIEWDRLGAYGFGVNDPPDARLLRFLGFDNLAVPPSGASRPGPGLGEPRGANESSAGAGR